VNLQELRGRTLKRLDQDPAAPIYFSAQEVTNALNRGQRLFALITLCLEQIVTFDLTPGTAFYRMLATYPDFLLPLRVRNASGAKVMPATLADLDALDGAWTTDAGPASFYGCLGLDLLFVKGSGGPLSITYARMPATLASDGDEAEIIDAYQPTLIDYATWRVRAKQGGQEFSRAIPYLKTFLDGAKAAAKDTLARAVAAGHDRTPFELKHYSKLLAIEVKK
jgi:hypothetical protein